MRMVIGRSQKTLTALFITGVLAIDLGYKVFSGNDTLNG